MVERIIVNIELNCHLFCFTYVIEISSTNICFVSGML